MYEQDIELARLLVEKLTLMQQRADKVRQELVGAESALDQVSEIRQEREAYLEVLSRAAKLLDRTDLQLESPESREAEENVKRLRSQLEEVENEASEYNNIIGELRQRAPRLLEAVELVPATSEAGSESFDSEPASEEFEQRAEEPVETADEAVYADSEEVYSNGSAPHLSAEENPDAVWQAEPETEVQPEVDPDPSLPQLEPSEFQVRITAQLEEGAAEATGSEAVTVAEEVAVRSPRDQRKNRNRRDNNGAAPAEQPAEVTVIDRKQVLQRFNLRNIRAKEAFTYGRNAIYVLDTPSIISRVPSYDIGVLQVQPVTVYRELLRDIDILSKEVSGSFYLIFDREFDGGIEVGEEVYPVGISGDGERTLEATRAQVRSLVGELSGRQRSVCLVTADKSLAESVSGPGVHIVQLADFFVA